MDYELQKRFPTNPKDYKLYEEVGEGVSATVFRALCMPLNEIVAIKVLDLEKCHNDLDGIRREVQTMSLIDHPNVLRAYCSFATDCSLWVVMPYMAGGSCLHIMKSAYPDGFEEPVIATILREVLKALVYLHGHGHIHRDVKSGNILVDDRGSVKLADFGVSACMFDTGDRQHSRNTFVGTPCWMAPEVMQQINGYDFKADIWSFGITALELAHGHAPFSKYPPMKVLLMTLQNAPPGLDYERDKKFSKVFRDMITICLAKDPKKRPSSEKLLKHTFFKHGRTNEFLARIILEGLPPLVERFRVLKERESDMLLQNKALNEENDHLSQQQYIRGISAWNFNLEELKAQAALLQSSDEISVSNDSFHKTKDEYGDAGIEQHMASPEAEKRTVPAAKVDDDELGGAHGLEGPVSSAFSSLPLEALKTCFDVYDDNCDATSLECKDSTLSSPDNFFQPLQGLLVTDHVTTAIKGESFERCSVMENINSLGCRKFSSGSLVPEHVTLDASDIPLNVERIGVHHICRSERNFSGPLPHRQIKDTISHTPVLHDDSSERRVFQQRGRFRVTSAEEANSIVAPSANSTVNHVGVGTSHISDGVSILPALQFLLQQNSLQREQVEKLIKHVEQASSCSDETSNAGAGDAVQLSLASSSRRNMLHSYVTQLQQSVSHLADEVQKLQLKNALLERQINTLAEKAKADDASGSGTVKRRTNGGRGAAV